MKAKKYLLLLLGTLLLPAWLNGTNTIISGQADLFRERIIRLSTYEDLLTRREQLLGSALIDKDGLFQLQVDVADTQQVFLSVGLRKFHFFICPGQSYQCHILAGADSLPGRLLPVFLQALEVILLDLPAADPNRVIASFDPIYWKFLENNATSLKTRRSSQLRDSLEKLVQNSIRYSSSSYTGYYIFYMLAGLESMAEKLTDRMIFDKYLKDKPVLYLHPAYMDYFNNFFQHYLSRKSSAVTSRDLEHCINVLGSLTALSDSLGKDLLLRNERIRELVLLQGLGEFYHDATYNREQVKRLIRQIAATSKFPQHRRMADNLLFQLGHLQKGSPAPVFSLTDQFGQEKSLEDFLGRWVYLGFFTSQCEPCMPGLKATEVFETKYGSKISFLHICCDEEKASYFHFIRENKWIRWPVFFLNDSFEIIRDYEAYAYPLHVLIDPEGSVFQYPASQAGGDITALFDSLMRR